MTINTKTNFKSYNLDFEKYNNKIANNNQIKGRVVDFDSYKINTNLVKKLDRVISLNKYLMVNSLLKSEITSQLKSDVEKHINYLINENCKDKNLLYSIINYLQSSPKDKDLTKLNQFQVTISETKYNLIDLLDIIKFHGSTFFTHGTTKTSERIIRNICLKNKDVDFNNKLNYYVNNPSKINKQIKDLIVAELTAIIQNNDFEFNQNIFNLLSPHSDIKIDIIKDENIRNMLKIISYHKNHKRINIQTSSALKLQNILLKNHSPNNRSISNITTVDNSFINE